MRNAFASELTSLANEDPRIILLSGDIGNRLFDNFKAGFPERFFNCGVAEANMTSIAAGMAIAGLRPVTYTITPFGTTRCLEQIRLDVCYQNLPVIIVGTGSGLGYASLNASHQSCEDIAFLRAIPNMTVICPGDAWELRSLLQAAFQLNGPVYLRIGKKGEPLIHSNKPELTIGKALIIKEGSEVCLCSTGNTLPLTVKAAEILKKRGISIQVVSLHTIKPLDELFLSHAFSTFKLLMSIEEHSLIGGLGSSIAEWLADNPEQKAHFVRVALPDKFLYEAGEDEYYRSIYGLTTETIVEKCFQGLQ